MKVNSFLSFSVIIATSLLTTSCGAFVGAIEKAYDAAPAKSAPNGGSPSGRDGVYNAPSNGFSDCYTLKNKCID